MPTYVVFSHLRWDFVHQRPQHLLGWIGRRHEVLFIEEPLFTSDTPWLEQRPVDDNVTVIRAHTNVEVGGFHDQQLPALRRLLEPVLGPLESPVAWFYTPMALPLLEAFEPGAIVYDCMDELSGFAHAPKQLKQREHALMQRADLVFAGGRSLYEAKRERHHSVHCFPSSVDAAHFGRANDAAIDSTSPRLGYFGVIDERIDLQILAALADAEPTWEIEVVGPVAKIDPAALPIRNNLHYLGMKPYADLPAIIATWDICLMPFALNDATRFISPTKVLEYMAAGKSIVSTPIRDVVEPYGHVVRIADTAEAFVDACRDLLAEGQDARTARGDAMREIVAATSWQDTADRMMELIASIAPEEARRRPLSVKGSVATRPLHLAVDAPASVPVSIGTAVIGAGPTGLSAAYHLDADSMLFERESTVGGWCRSIEDNGFTFDHAGHIMFSNDPVVHEMYRVLLGDNVHWQNREAWVYSHGVHTRYPFQGALYGLPPEVLKECLVGAIEARFGTIDGSAAGNVPAVPANDPDGALDETDSVIATDDCCGDGEHVRPDSRPAPPVSAAAIPATAAPANFEDFIYRTWGRGVAKHFAIPYNQKLWATPLKDMETSWLGGRVPLPDLAEMIEGAVQPSKKPVGPNARFGYPLRGGFQALMNGFLPYVNDRLQLDADIVAIDLDRKLLTLADGRRFRYEQLVSTMPLPRLIATIGAAAPQAIHEAVAALRHISVRCVNLGVDRTDVTDKHWIYYPGDTVFHRIFVQGNTSPHCNPPGGFGLTCEITHAPSKPLPCNGDELIQRCFDDCVRVGLLRASDRLLAANQVDMEYAYVVYDHVRAANVAAVRAWLAQHDVFLAGRYSEWEYYNSDHAFLAGRRVAAEVQAHGLRQLASA